MLHFGRALFAVSLLAIAGCSSGGGINLSNFNRLRTGMPATEVEDILGKGTELKADEVRELMQSTLAPPVDPSINVAKEESVKQPPIDVSNMRGLRWKDGKRTISVLFQADRMYLAFKDGF